MHRRFLGVFVLICSAVAGAQVPVYEALWYLKGTPESARKVSLQVQAEREAPIDKLYSFACEIESKLDYRNALVSITLLDAGGKPVFEGSQEMPLASGASRCTFDLDPAKLAPGTYTAEFMVEYTEREQPATFTAHIRRVSSGDLHQQLASAMETLAKAPEGDPAQKPNYASLRVRIAKDYGANAAADAAAGKWRLFAEKVDYAVKSASGATAGIAMSGLMPELAEAPASLPLAELRAEGAGYAVNGTPVFLFGSAVATPEDAARIQRFGLNYAVATIRPADTTTPDVDKNVAEAYGPLFSAIDAANLASVVSLDAGGLAGWPLERIPAANAEGFVDVARADVQAIAERHMKAALPYLNGQPSVVGVSLFNAPQFKFQGTEIHRRFLEDVQTRYPDRQLLNAHWSAHLAKYEDITVWGKYVDGRPDPKIPDHHYENKRAYKFDWQAFHLGLMKNYLDHARDLARGLAPQVPLTVTLPDTAFEKNETVHSPDREALARDMDYSSTTLTAGAADPIYAIAYPHADASLTLLQSLDPTKPVNVEQLQAAIDDTMAPEALYDYVQTLAWNSVVAGADAIALAPGSAVFEHPNALEAFATAAIDINRLAPVVSALQNAPTDVAILYSDSSKILDGGDPHLKSTAFAYEGSAFFGMTTRYVTERACMEGTLNSAKVLVLAETPALRGETFKQLEAFVDAGGIAARVGSPIPYDEHGRSRTSVIRNTGKTIIVRGMNLPTEYLHAMDGVGQVGKLPTIPRPINGYEYPLEGVKTRFVEHDGTPYLYIVNLRKDAVNCYLEGSIQSGRDLIRGKDVVFPAYLEPLQPMLLRLDADLHRTTIEPVAAKK